MISYSTVQGRLAERLYKELKDLGYSPKLSQLDLRGGDEWREVLAKWLSTCELAVVLMSEDALASQWVRHELSVLANRHKVERSMRLVLVYVGVRRQDVDSREEFEPLALADIQAPAEYDDVELDDGQIAELAAAIKREDDAHEGDLADPSTEKLVERVGEEVHAVSPERLATARKDLVGIDDPWLRPHETGANEHERRRRAFARAYCATALQNTYPALQTLAQDRNLDVEVLDKLIDYNVMTTFDQQLIRQLHRAAAGEVRRSMVTATTRTDLADVSTQAVPIIHEATYPYRFTVNGPLAGVTVEDLADGLADELRHAIRTARREDPGKFLAAVARRRHPVYVFVNNTVGLLNGDVDDDLERKVLARLEQDFPSVVFVVLSSEDVPMGMLARHLAVDGLGTDIADPTEWAEWVAWERELATERLDLRDDLRRLTQDPM